MGGAAKARNKGRPRRGPARPAAAGGAAPGPAAQPAAPQRPFEARGAVPGQRPEPGRALPPNAPQVPGQPASEGRPMHGLPPTSLDGRPVSTLPARAAKSQSPSVARLSLAVEAPLVATSSTAAAPATLPGPSSSFARGYAAPADAVRCAMLGSPPTFWFEGDAGRLTVAVESGRLVATAVVHIGEDLAQLVAAVLLNHEGEPADAVGPVRAALEELADLSGYNEAEVTADLSGASPRLGWLSRFDPAPWVTWHDWWAAFAASPAGRTAAALSTAGDSAEADGCFARQGLRVVRCAEPGCRAPLTDRHPTWGGVWSAAGGTLGPVCAVSAQPQAWPAGLLTAVPHRIAEG
jgi:hypothetical protein